MPDPTSHPAYLRPYREALERFGPGFEATLWRDRATQKLRFDVAMQSLDFRDRRIADLGCGPGDLLDHLGERDVPLEAYLGVDAQPEMIELAQAGHQGLQATFLALDIATDFEQVAAWKPDICMFSGTLNTMSERTAWRLVKVAFIQSKVGVVFNFLSNRAHPRCTDGKDLWPARRFNTTRWIDRCLRETSRVSFRQDYLDGHDATITMIKEDA